MTLGKSEIKGANLATLINNYNGTAGTLTPAGQALVSAGLFTQAQLVAIGAVKQPLIAPPTNPLNNDTTRTMDVSFHYPISFHRYREGLSLVPGVAIYNVGNFSNYGGFSSLADTTVSASTLSSGSYLNAPTDNGLGQAQLNRSRVLRGSGNGTFDQGGPRTTEFQLKLNF